MVTFISSKGNNQDYRAHISCPGHDVDVIVDLPETISFGISSDWESLLPYSLAGALDAVAGKVGVNLGAAFGAVKAANVQSQALSFQVWMGTSPIEIPFTFQFDAKTSALEQVYKPIAYLMALTMPVNKNFTDSAYTNVLLPPGPALGGGLVDDYSVTLRLGRMMAFLDCIITSATPSFDVRLDDEGYPIAGEIEMTFRTSKVYGHIDMLNAMGIGVTR